MKQLINILESVLSNEYDIDLLKLNWYRNDNGKPYYDVEEELAKPKPNIPFLNVMAYTEIKTNLGDTDAHYYSHIHVPGVKNWPRFIGRLEHIGKYRTEKDGGVELLVWSGIDLMEALTEGIKKDIGKNITKREAENLIFDDGVLIAMFVGTNLDYYGIIYIGVSDKQVYEFRVWNGDSQACVYGPGFASRLRTIETKNWRFKKMPANTFDIIKTKLNLP